MTIEITQQMVDGFSDEAIERGTEVADLERVQVWDGLKGALEGITPDAQRDLAAQLLQAANEAEGHANEAPSEDAADGGRL
jgi:hypothetical protein